MAGADEIDGLFARFGGNGKPLCKVIENQGDYSKIITVQPSEDSPIKIQFSLYDTYPNSAPDIFVKSVSDKLSKQASVSGEFREELRSKLLTLAESSVGKPMLLSIMDECVTALNEKYPGQSGTAKPELVDEKPKTVSAQAVTVSEPVAKSKMRTASDVISRILWDEKLDRSCFTVGYNDRFAGLIEEKFNAFTWDQPLSAVDNDTLAIPQHRIQYFKYKQVKVWDKNERLDLVFGSTGDGGDIYALVDQFETAVDKAKETNTARRVPGSSTGEHYGHRSVPDFSDHEEMPGALVKWSFEEVLPGGARLKTGGPQDATIWIVGDSHTRSLLGCVVNRIVQVENKSVFIMSRGGAPASIILKDATDKLRNFQGKLDCLVLHLGANDLLQLAPAKSPEEVETLDKFFEASEKKLGSWVYVNAERIGSLVFVECYQQRPRNLFVQGRRSTYPRAGFPQQDIRVRKWNEMLRRLAEKIATAPDPVHRIEKSFTVETESWLHNDHPKAPSEVYNSDHFYDGIHLNYDPSYNERNSLCFEPLPIRWTYALKVFQAVRSALMVRAAK